MNNKSSAPFVSEPLSAEADSSQIIQAAHVPSVANPMQPVPISAQVDEMESLYPEIYREVYPLVSDVADKMIAGGYNPTPDAISAIVDNIIKNSGLWYEDEDDERFGMEPEVVPVQFGFGRMPLRRRRRRHHNRDTLRDVIRILLLRELLGRRNGFPHRGY